MVYLISLRIHKCRHADIGLRGLLLKEVLDGSVECRTVFDILLVGKVAQ